MCMLCVCVCVCTQVHSVLRLACEALVTAQESHLDVAAALARCDGRLNDANARLSTLETVTASLLFSPSLPLSTRLP